ncbi:hypothetical protein KDE13_09165 [Campylobacter sp. faydin G-140]|uniref:hypothetical protein n=1 Tax=Campylobacter anatolicus TaxID=2829105 RepID=UPI001B99474D|nr:hypothetical protein [Campylobacter anatolicus]MBR8466502.1 hypothetical protein [Campylobacter anatolicus]
MKKIILTSAIITSFTLANPLDSVTEVGKEIGGFIGKTGRIINSGFDLLGSLFDKIDELSYGTLSKCYPISTPKVDLCDRLPDLEARIPNVCSLYPYSTGNYSKVYSSNEYLKKYCSTRDKQKGKESGTIDTVQTSSQEISSSKTGGGKYSGGSTPKQHYGSGGNGSFGNVISEKSASNTAFISEKWDNLKAIDDYSKASGKAVKDITPDDIVATLPATQDDYFKERDNLVAPLTADLIEYSPYNVAIMLEQELKSLQGTSAKNKADNIINTALRKLEEGDIQRKGFALNLYRNKDDLIYTSQEFVKLFRDDKKIETVAKIKEQQLREVKILADIDEEAQTRKNLLLLTEQKALIMNEKFNRDLIRQEINSLIN